MSEKLTLNTDHGNYNENIQGNYYHQNGNVGIGHMTGGEIKGRAKVAGTINEINFKSLAEELTGVLDLWKQLKVVMNLKRSKNISSGDEV